MYVNFFSWNIILMEELNGLCMKGIIIVYLKFVVLVLIFDLFIFEGSKKFWLGIYKIIFIKYLNSVFNYF